MSWITAMERALYGPGGFFVGGAGPAGHFRTSANATPAFAAAVTSLLSQVDAALGHPDRLDLVDVGAGRAELLTAILRTAPEPLRARLRPVAVELAPRPAGLPPGIEWRADLPTGIVGLLIATEWLDNVPLDVADTGHYVLVDPDTGEESPGDPVTQADQEWLDRWWPSAVDAAAAGDAIDAATAVGPADPAAGERPEVGERQEIGRPRDLAWASAVRAVERGLAVTVDYGHLADTRPLDGTLTGFRAGRQVPPVPNGDCDVTAHVAMDSVAYNGSEAAGQPYLLMSQREALKALGADGGRPPISLASSDPVGYVRALAAASAVGELTDPAGLGGHWWLLQPVKVDPQSVTAGPAKDTP